MGGINNELHKKFVRHTNLTNLRNQIKYKNIRTDFDSLIDIPAKNYLNLTQPRILIPIIQQTTYSPAFKRETLHAGLMRVTSLLSSCH